VEGREGAGGFHPYPWRYRLYRNRRWLSGSLPAEKKVAFPCIQGGRRHRGGSFRIDTAARYSLLLGSSKISRLKLCGYFCLASVWVETASVVSGVSQGTV
jgi:hypothetical protein